MVGSTLLITAVFFAFLVAGAISLFLTYKQTSKVVRENSLLADEVESQKKKQQKLQEQYTIQAKTLCSLREKTAVEIPNSSLYDAQKPTYLLQSDGKWHKVPNNQPKAYIGPFRAYFQATSASATRALNMTIEDSEATAVDAVIRTIDADGTEHYYDMNGRLLSGKPQKGMYIHNGKKYINK